MPAGDGRSIFALPWLGASLLGTTDNNYDGNIDHVRPSPEDIDYLLESGQHVLRHGPRPRRPGRGVRRRPAADLQRATLAIRRHLAQGGAVRDLQRPDHDHRRQAHTWRRMAKIVVDQIVERMAATRRPDTGNPTRLSRSIRRDCRVSRAPSRISIPRSPRATATRPNRSWRRRGGTRGARARRCLRECRTCSQRLRSQLRNEQAEGVADALPRRTRLGLLAGRTLIRSARRGTDARARASAPSSAGTRHASRWSKALR